jgi:hypothetical protein
MLLNVLALASASVLITNAAGLRPAMAQSVNGQTVRRISFSNGTGTDSIVMVAPGQWKQYRQNGAFFADFVEMGRDEWSVYLRDSSRNVNLQIDLFQKTVTAETAPGQRGAIGKILSSAAMTAAAAAPANTLAEPQTAATTTMPVTTPAATPTKTAAADLEDEDFNPFADPEADATPVTTPKTDSTVKQTTTPTTTPKVPDFVNNRQNNNANNTAAATSPFVGPWVDAFAKYERKGDGLKGPVNWTAPQALVITSANPSTLNVFLENGAVFVLQKTGETTFAGSGATAQFTPVENRYTMQFNGPGLNKTFAMAQTSDGTLTRDRFSETERENRTGGFAQGTFSKEWNNMFFSYQGEDMDLFNAENGKKKRIFKQPGQRDYTLDDNMGQSLPFGVLGIRNRRSSSEQLETMITNQASFQESMSYNFGASGGDPAKAGLGVSVSREESKGSEKSSTEVKAMGIARVERYILLLDKPNIELDPLFKNNLKQVALGQMSAAQFIQNYGTHYAAAIHLGGLGKAERTMRSQEIKDFAQKSLSVSAQGGAKGVTLNGGFSQTSGSSVGSNSLFSNEKWEAVGGAGSMSSLGWAVGDDDTVPVRYDLRPLSDLLSPLFFKEEWDGADRARFLNGRANLEAAIGRYMASQPRLSNKSFGPKIYRVTFHSLVCFQNGDEGKRPAELFGKLTATLSGTDGVESVDLFNMPEGTGTRRIDCNGGEIPLNQTKLVMSGRDPAQDKAFFMLTAGMYEDDNSFDDPDDPLVLIPTPVNLSQWRADHPRTDIQGTVIGNPPGVPNWGPTIAVKASFQEVQ